MQLKHPPESSWLVARRCLSLLRRLQQGAAGKHEIMNTIYGQQDEPVPAAALAKRFDADKRRLSDHLGVKIKYSREAAGYVIDWWERPLLNLPDAHIETLAFLADTFQPDTPHAEQVHALIDQLVAWLPDERVQVFDRVNAVLPDVDLRLRDSEEIAAEVWQKVVTATSDRQELTFDYLSSRHEDGIPRRHHVQPWELTFTDRGHYRLRGYCLFNDGPHGPWEPRDYFHYRLSRIVPGSVQILSKKLPPIRPSGKPRQVLYELAPAIARFGVSQRKELIGEPVVTSLENDWVRVNGRTHDLFELARNLLYYGANCRVLGGEELLRETKTLVSELAMIYQ